MTADTDPIARAARNPREPAILVWSREAMHAWPADRLDDIPAGMPVYSVPPVFPEWLGDAGFRAAHGLRFAYVVGAMARGIATAQMVIEAAQAGGIGFFGSAGLTIEEIDTAIGTIAARLEPQGLAWGANIIHTPQEPGHEAGVVDLFIQRGVRRASASAYLRLSPEIVRYTAAGLSRGQDGAIHRANHVFAKVSRAEVAAQFMSPAPERMLRELVASGRLYAAQAELAARVPVAAEITAESDSGGHTDNRPAAPLFSSLAETRREVCARHGWPEDLIRIGLAGGIATPQAVAGAFQMGAAYVLTGSVNQACAESGLSRAGREMLAAAGPADVMMAPAADMFEQGIRVQVLKRGTLFAPRGEKLYAMYRGGARLDTLSPKDAEWLEGVLGETLPQAWQATREFLASRAPATLAHAENDTARQFALICRRYLFQGAQWARDGDIRRKSDFQIWCGPAMGAFNSWVKNSPLEPVENRTIRQVILNLMESSAILTRTSQMRSMGLVVPAGLFNVRPIEYS